MAPLRLNTALTVLNRIFTSSHKLQLQIYCVSSLTISSHSSIFMDMVTVEATCLPALSASIAIQPWERSLIAAIEKAIINANLGFTPQNNGEVIRCPIPPLTEERRKELIKKAKAAGENAKVAVRNSRRDGVESLKKGEKAGDFSEDVRKEGEDEIQKVTDAKIKVIDSLVSAKEKEIMTV